MQTLVQLLPSTEDGYYSTMYFIVLDGKQHSVYCTNEYVEALEEAAQLDYMYNSPELNNGVQGTHEIKLLTLSEMMMSDVEMVI